MARTKEIQIFVGSLSTNATFTTSQLPGPSGETIKVLNNMQCVSPTGRMIGDHKTQVWQKDFDPEEDFNGYINQTTQDKLRYAQRHSRCNRCFFTGRLTGGCKIRNDKYWNR